MPYKLWRFFGLQRSGNHAIINWLMGLDQENTLFFNTRKPGTDILSNPSGVSLPEGHKSYAVRVSGKKIINEDIAQEFKDKKDRWNLFVSHENYDMEKFDASFLNKPIIKKFGEPEETYNIVIIRNPFNMIPSTEKLLRKKIKKRRKKIKFIRRIRLSDDDIIESSLYTRALLWKKYAFLCLNSHPVSRGKFYPVIFDKWVGSKEYRDRIANDFNYENRDLFLDFVSDAGKGSSFDGHELSNRDDTLLRWHQGNKRICDKVISSNPELIDYTALIFGNDAIPEDVKSAYLQYST